MSQKQVHLFCSSTTTKSFQWNPNYFISGSTFTLIISDRWCQVFLLSHFISPVITPEQANPRRCLLPQEDSQRKVMHSLGASPQLIPPTSFCPCQHAEGFSGYFWAHITPRFYNDCFTMIAMHHEVWLRFTCLFSLFYHSYFKPQFAWKFNRFICNNSF